jgi:two-component system chemotaxis response regulator CheY
VWLWKEDGRMSKVIMIVEDSATMRQMVGFTLKRNGYEVIEAEDGSDALGKINGNPIHMIITDLNMPNMDGLEFIRNVRQNPSCKYTPIIMLTTESQETKKSEGRAAGATGWIVKPFSPEQLMAVVEKVIK